MEVSNKTQLLHGSKTCSRKPPAPEMVFFVRGKYALDATDSLRLFRSPLITDAHVETARQAGELAANDMLRASIQLGQWSLIADTYEDGDEERMGAPLYPGDFSDFKLNAEVMLRGRCHPPKDATECEVAFGVGDFEKRLQVVGHRVRTDDMPGGATEPTAIDSISVDYTHAYGGPGYANNPVGKGHIEAARADDDGNEVVYQPPRSHRSAVMPTRQLPNVLFADGSETQGGLPAGFGPLNPAWPHRADRVGKQYDADWRKNRAPYFSADFDWRFFHCAPPDQQIEGYLRGDEEVWFENLLPGKRKTVRTRLPEIRVRVFVMDDQQQIRELSMVLDTLFADLEEGALYLTWRGHTEVRENDLDDIQFALVKTEPMSEPPRRVSEYEAELRAFADDPINMAEAFPEGFLEHAKAMEALENATDDELDAKADAIMATDDPGGPLAALMKLTTPPSAHEGMDEQATELKKAADQIEEHGEPGALKKKVRETLDRIGRPNASPLILPVGGNDKPRLTVGKDLNEFEKQLHAQRDNLELPRDAEIEAGIEKGLERLRTSPLAELDPNYKPWTPDGPGDDEPGPGADLSGRDLSGLDLSGVDLTGANLEGATLGRTNLRGANLTDARMSAVAMFKTDLREANFTGATLSQATLHRVDARGAVLEGVELTMANITSSDLTGANLKGATGLMATFSKCNLEGTTAADMALTKSRFESCSVGGADWSAVNLDGCELRECEANKLQLRNAKLHGSAFHKTEMGGASAAGAEGRGSVWMQCQLGEVDFSGAYLPASFFTKSDASRSLFAKANLEEGRFDRANLSQADFTGAKLSHANLRKTLLSDACFRKASLYDAKVIEAAGTNVDMSGTNLDLAVFDRSEISRL